MSEESQDDPSRHQNYLGYDGVVRHVLVGTGKHAGDMNFVHYNLEWRMLLGFKRMKQLL